MKKKLTYSIIAVMAIALIIVLSFTISSTKEQTVTNKEKTTENAIKETEIEKIVEEDEIEEKVDQNEQKKAAETIDEENEIEDNKDEIVKEEDNSEELVTKASDNSPKEEKKTATKTETKTSTSTKLPKKDEVTTKSTTSTETIPFKTITENDNSLEKGKQLIAQNGVNGVKTITYKETYTNGKLTSKVETSSSVTKQPVNKIVKIGTKEATLTQLTASQAHSILSGSGMSRSGNFYSLRDDFGEIIGATVDGDGVSNIRYNGRAYISYGSSQAELIEILGEEDGKKEYQYGLQERAKIEKAVRAAANAVYGSGTAKANSLYSQIIGSTSYGKSF